MIGIAANGKRAGSAHSSFTIRPGSPFSWFTYDEDSDGAGLTITGLSQEWHDLDDPAKNNLIIPSALYGKRVAEIGSYAFVSEKNTLVSVIVDEPVYITGIFSIATGAFQGCFDLKTVIIPDSVISIGNIPFFLCFSLESVVIKSKSPPQIGNCPFAFLEEPKRTIFVPNGSVEAYKTAPIWSDYASQIVGF